ncbi:transmembrane protein 53-A [Salarias fasciatus]|uniref:Transmembrane protein 53-A-like n=1 Tax=Salarias fasciatus TaxID=181472 RepID=A0A672GNW0_SALFA|nr:transmembrane protein 53-A-like [Salarias fasciatus]
MLARAAMGSTGVITHRLGKNVTLYVNELTSCAAGRLRPAPEESKPILLMLPWLFSHPQAQAKYCDIYFQSGFDVLVVDSEVKDFLWPRWGLDRGQRLLELLHTERFVSRPLLVHAFSIGGYTFAQLLVHMSKDVQKYEEFTKRIRGQVFDSLVLGTVEQMAAGLGKTVLPRWDTLLKKASLLYFNTFRQQTVDYYNLGIDTFWNTPVKAPALFFFCDNDVMSDSEVVTELIAYWRKRGIDVTAKQWKESVHAGHLKKHPQEYLTTLNMFLHSIYIGQPKAKM